MAGMSEYEYADGCYASVQPVVCMPMRMPMGQPMMTSQPAMSYPMSSDTSAANVSTSAAPSLAASPVDKPICTIPGVQQPIQASASAYKAPECLQRSSIEPYAKKHIMPGALQDCQDELSDSMTVISGASIATGPPHRCCTVSGGFTAPEGSIHHYDWSLHGGPTSKTVEQMKKDLMEAFEKAKQSGHVVVVESLASEGSEPLDRRRCQCLPRFSCLPKITYTPIFSATAVTRSEF